MLLLMETLPDSLAHPSDEAIVVLVEVGSSQNSGRLPSTSCTSQCEVVGKTASSWSVWVQILVTLSKLYTF